MLRFYLILLFTFLFSINATNNELVFKKIKVDWNYTHNDLLSDTIDDLKSRMDYK